MSSQSALESNKLGYQVGVRINIDVLECAAPVAVSTREDLSRARYDTIMNGLRLKAAAGSLREADLIPVNNSARNKKTAPSRRRFLCMRAMGSRLRGKSFLPVAETTVSRVTV